MSNTHNPTNLQSSKLTYLFIDGSYLRESYIDSTSKWFGNEVENDNINIDFNAIKFFFNAQKVFYYDYIDRIQGKYEEKIDFEERVSQQKDYFNQIRSLEEYHVKLGNLTKKGQKEVHILLTVDMMNHAIRNNMTKAVLLSGDKDFKPLVESLVNMGMIVYVSSEVRSTSSDLKYAADSYIPLSFFDYYKWSSPELKNKYPMPKIETYKTPLLSRGLEKFTALSDMKIGKKFGSIVKVSEPQNAELLDQGTVKGYEVKLFQKDREFILFFRKIKDSSTFKMSLNNQDRLELYYALEYGKKIKWD
ncbi:MAG: NYN domain-containing protein [Okeania sp. SIO2C9]|uniref:NYN domain-containing protein n=1 Tax=Okeania sp. SIO2C9 TaxID=2607791 RepID=UPI0013BECBCD|nr:NYN domain-containing protein [Okeania sp. SIO2C9]NEQ76362.1 NYN domain-containing protein [Okeania sp. SIO2C9]